MNLTDKEINEISDKVSGNIEALVIEAIKVINMSLEKKFDGLKDKLITDITENIGTLQCSFHNQELTDVKKRLTLVEQKMKSIHKSIQLLNWIIGMPFRWFRSKPLRLSYLVISISILIFLIVSGCSPQKRLNRLIVAHPELLQPKTFKISDIIKVPGKSVVFNFPIDSIISLKENDSLIRSANNIKRVICRNNDTIKEIIFVLPDTIHYNNSFDVPQAVVKEIPKTKWGYIAAVTLFLLMLAALIRILRK